MEFKEGTRCHGLKYFLNFAAFDQLCSSSTPTPKFLGLHRSNHVAAFVFSISSLIRPSNRLVHSAKFEFE